MTIARPTNASNTGVNTLNKAKKESASRPFVTSIANSVCFLLALSASQPPNGENTTLGK